MKRKKKMENDENNNLALKTLNHFGETSGRPVSIGVGLGAVAGVFSEIATGFTHFTKVFTTKPDHKCVKHGHVSVRKQLVSSGENISGFSGIGLGFGSCYGAMRSAGHYSKLSRDKSYALRKGFTKKELEGPRSVSK